MMENNNNRLERVLELLADSQKGYSEAADIADDGEIKTMFQDRARSRAMIMEEFSDLMPSTMRDESSGSGAGAAHRMFINLRRLVQDDTRVALAEVERGESTFLEALRDALDDTSLTGTARTMVSSLHEQVQRDHDQFAQMKALY